MQASDKGPSSESQGQNPEVIGRYRAKTDQICSLEGLLPLLLHKVFSQFWIDPRQARTCYCLLPILFMNLKNNTSNLSTLEGRENDTKFSINMEWCEHLD